MNSTEKTAFLFSGQGSQYGGMGKELAEMFPSGSRKIFECGNDILGFDVKELMFEGTDAELSRTAVSQPAIFTMSLIALNAAKEKGIVPSAAAGHSLGEYAAMVCAGILTMEQGFEAIKYRASCMEKCAEENPGAMTAVIGLPPETIEQMCAEITSEGDYLEAVNYNSPVQTVIAGTKSAVDKAAKRLKENGAKRILPLAVSAAFHSEIMKPAAGEFLKLISDFKFAEPSIPFYSNLTGEKRTDFSSMPSYLSAHICSPVLFTKELNTMKNDGFDVFIELGPGKVLTGLVKKTLSGVTALNIEDAGSLSKALEVLS